MLSGILVCRRLRRWRGGRAAVSGRGETGKVADGETVADGPVVAENRSNVQGAKEPAARQFAWRQGRPGRMIQTPSSLQDPRSGVYGQGETEEVGEAWSRFWVRARIESAADGRRPRSLVVKRAGEPSAGNRQGKLASDRKHSRHLILCCDVMFSFPNPYVLNPATDSV
jgi:hypothetical protein